MLVKSQRDNDTGVDDLSTVEAKKELSSPDANRRREAAVALYGRKAALSALVDRLEEEDTPAVREAIINSLISLDSPKVVDTFIAKLRGDEAERRNEAVYALQQMPERSAQKVKKLLIDADADVRIMAVDIIRLLTISDAPEWLGVLLETEDNPNVVGVAVDRLSEIGSINELPVLEAVIERFSGDAYLQFATNHAIDRIKAIHSEGPI
ncbi:HEAT repeat domain-containing protein [Marivivens aquimaris]|uniref:HEAT repeat domain-containing protein n=1 Tax=Marivivens aquimaris TaxID=2774876 RepID=UPI001882FF8E|nr:HEAT repeat domain-containing protein [Marivivens aquimaris]